MTGGEGTGHRSAIDILEEAVRVLKTYPSALLPYFMGTLPFVLGLLYFWTDMSRGANAWQHCPQGAWGLTLLFLWMKTWHALYARGLLAAIRGEARLRWGVRRILHAAVIQAAIQPLGIILLPVAFVIMIPFPQAFAFFQNATLMGSGDEQDMGKVIKHSWAQASLWPGQNMLIIWLASPFLVMMAALFLFAFVPVLLQYNLQASGFPLFLAVGLVMIPLCPLGIIVALNGGLCLFLAPWLLRTIFGIETVFSMGGPLVINETSLAVICGFAYLCLDPVLKAAYCLRCFYGDALRTGEDLLVALRSLGRPALPVAIFLAVFLGCASVGHAVAQAPSADAYGSSRPVSAGELDAAIGRAIARPQYTWRMPRMAPPPAPRNHGIISAFLDSIVKALRVAWGYVEKGLSRLWLWVRDIITRMVPPAPGQVGGDGRWTYLSRVLIFGPLLALMAAAAFLGWRAWRQRRIRTIPSEAPERPLPDITRADVDASALPEDGWLAMAREMMEAGEPRLALRALYLATLAFLARKDLITLAPHKSDREYEREVRLHGHVHPLLPSLFTENRIIFERAWYGLHEVTPGIIERFSRNQEGIRDNGQE